MPLVSEDQAKSEYLYQEVREDGILTVCQKMMTGISSKQMATFGYDLDRMFVPIADGRMAF